eukprot:gene6179-6246_t
MSLNRTTDPLSADGAGHLNGREGLRALTAPFVLLEDRLHKGKSLLYTDLHEVVSCHRPADLATAFGRIEAGLARGLHAAGFFSYELGYAFEPHLRGFLQKSPSMPLLWIGLFAAPQELESAMLDQAFATLPPPAPVKNLVFGHDRAAHMAKVSRVLDYLSAGDAYQVNVTFDIGFEHSDPLALYGAMRARQPVAHGGFIATGEASLLSVSPELFLEIAEGHVTTRPMKGTVPRGADQAQDADNIARLRADPKQQAENVMIVDLMRNDLARISKVGSVQVPHLFQVETYPTLHTLTSTITAELKAHLGLSEMIRAVFPCGSITGAPKHRAMEIIHELENAPRGVYTGSMGHITPDGTLNLNVAIRTATVFADGRGHYGVGGGIVMDSDPAGEYDECLLKARVLTDLAREFGLIETFRWTADAGFARLNMHLLRLSLSAKTLGFTLDPKAMEAAFASLDLSLRDLNLDQRIRLEVARDGTFSLTHAPLGPEPDHILHVGIATQRLDAGDPFLRHKTTQRDIYERAFAEGTAQGLDEALLLNRQGELCETTRNSIFIEHKGQLLTPPLSAGSCWMRDWLLNKA